MKLGQTGKRDKLAKPQTSPLQTSRHHQDWHATNSSLMLPWGSSSGWLANSRGNWTLTVNSVKFKSWDLQVASGCQKQIPWLPRSGDWSNGYPLQASESVFEQRRQQAGRRRISSSLSAPSGHHHIGTTAHPVLASLCRHGRQQGVDSSWLQGVLHRSCFSTCGSWLECCGMSSHRNWSSYPKLRNKPLSRPCVK